MLDQLRSGKSGVLAIVLTLYITFIGGRVVFHQIEQMRDGSWAQRRTDLALDEDVMARRELGPLAPWIAAIRAKTPEDAVIGVRFLPEHEHEAPGWIASLRFLAWPRRVLTPQEFLDHIGGDGANLDGKCFGLQLPDEEPPFAQRWRVVAKGRGWRLYRWIEEP